MWLFLLLAALAGPALLFLLARGGRALRGAQAEPLPVPDRWPSVGLIVPCAGSHPDMERALRSLLGQNYAGPVRPVFVTATDNEPAAELIARLQADFPDLRHETAGKAVGCGQKNWNLLRGVAALEGGVDIYVFCDSTHLASPDFLSRLTAPLAAGEALFTTGYHEVVPGDREAVTLAYAFCVLAMRILQGQSGLTQPWGGAMAVLRTAFESHEIARFWADKVVDDCSLTTWLRDRGVRVRLCPGALLRTRAEHHRFDVWRAWLDRQILFLRFCVPGQWVALGVLLLAMALLPAVMFLAALGFCLDIFGGAAGFCALVHLLATAVGLARLRPLLPHHVPLVRLMGAFWLTCFCACSTFLGTLTARGILWHGIWYRVGKDGKVLGSERRRTG